MYIVLGNLGDGWEVVSEEFCNYSLALDWLVANGENADEYEPDNFPEYAIVTLNGMRVKITGKPRLEKV